jgi:hypothetical protein
LDTWKNREQFLIRKWPLDKEEVSYRRVINCTNAVELRCIGKYWYKVRLNGRIKLVRCKLELGRER